MTTTPSGSRSGIKYDRITRRRIDTAVRTLADTGMKKITHLTSALQAQGFKQPDGQGPIRYQHVRPSYHRVRKKRPWTPKVAPRQVTPTLTQSGIGYAALLEVLTHPTWNAEKKIRARH